MSNLDKPVNDLGMTLLLRQLLVCGVGHPTCPQRGSTAVDPPPLKGHQMWTLCSLLQEPKITTKALPLSDFNTNKDLSRTPQGCLAPPQRGCR